MSMEGILCTFPTGFYAETYTITVQIALCTMGLPSKSTLQYFCEDRFSTFHRTPSFFSNNGNSIFITRMDVPF